MGVVTGGGGGAGPFKLLGPFTVAYTDLDPVTYVDLGAVAAGTILWRVYVEITTAFDNAGESITAGFGAIPGDSPLPIYACLATAQTVVGSGLTSFEADPKSGSTPNIVAAYQTKVVRAVSADNHLTVQDNLGGNSTGVAVVRVLASS